MPQDLAEAVLDKVKQYTIGFARAGDKPAAKGSGVLIKHGSLHGILTCAHVDQYLRTLKQPIGLVRLNRGSAQQFGTLDMGDIFSYAAGEEPWDKGDDDISFIHLPPNLVGNIEKDCVFLDAERNFTKPEPEDRSSLIPVFSVFGLVERFTSATTRQGGMATTTLKGVLTSGVPRDFGALNITLECFEQNIPDLPSSFGGTSGGGLWRVYARKDEGGSFEAVHHRLIGTASREELDYSPPRIICQGMGRVEALLEGVRRGNIYP
ncbi:MAG TPA: hypothetical protein VE111_03600 [Bradyrhizobium sp.]|nr:hypothetical protein [Bradyrhizobium sp.]